MRTTAVFFAVVCLIGLGHAQDDQWMGGKCSNELQSTMTEFGQAILTFDFDEIREKVCKAVKDLAECILHTAYTERPSDAEIANLQNEIQTTNVQLSEWIPNMDCDLNVETLADDVWGSNGALTSGRPWQVLAITTVSVVAVLLSHSMY